MDKKYKIVLTGPESTGKSSLSKYLANYYNTNSCGEYAREYVERLKRHYTYKDVETIAKRQIVLEEQMLKKANKILFVDTSLIITKIWFKIAYNQIPKWFNQKLQETLADFYLLCNTETEWKYDPVRENGGEMREILFQKYKKELELYNVDFEIVSGSWEERYNNAADLVNRYLYKENITNIHSKMY